VMNQGQAVEYGACDAVLKRPQMEYTRMLLASVPDMTPPPARPACNGSGYKGRIGLFEAVRIDDEIRRLINQGADETAIAAQAFKANDTLSEAARALVRDGMTSPEEAVRVSRQQEAADA